MAAPVLKGGRARLNVEWRVLTGRPSVIQIMISQIILGYRAWAITRRSRDMGILLLGLGIIVTALEWYSNVDARIPVQDEVSGRDVTAARNAAPHGNYYFYSGEVRRFVHVLGQGEG